ncbi:MAG: type I 3-dehydroquinate dehydratase [Eubacteriales bacterium]|nr:type I 3-dehydroquinate dehydratase [Eubacteriales bacterium]
MKRTLELMCGTFGAGRPKICVPIVDREGEGILRSAERIARLPADLVEWRADFCGELLEERFLLEMLEGLRRRLGKKTILYTMRTKGEGGELSADADTYFRLNRAAAASGFAELVDVEAFFAGERTGREIRAIQEAGSRVIASFHNFDRTPGREEMVNRLLRMEELGADVAKLAVMPECPQDVLELLEATAEADRRLEIPVVTMSMGKLGAVSRVSGTLTGSAMTFASAGDVSAPGQIPIERMTEIMDVL